MAVYEMFAKREEMRRYGFEFVGVFVIALLLASCSQELAVTSTEGAVGTPVQFALGIASFNATAGSSAVATRSTDHSTVDEAIVSNVRTLQFSSDGLTLLSNVYTSPADTTNLVVALHPATDSHIYFVANAGSDDSNDPLKSFTGTETAFKTLTKTLTQESDLLYTTSTNRINLPMISDCQVVTIPNAYTLVDKRSTPIALTRTVACLIVNYNVQTSDFVLNGIRVCNIPNRIEYCPPAAAGATATYPTGLTTISVISTGYTSIPSGTAQSGTLYYYIPENQRGKTTAAIEKQKSGVANDYATYVEMEGYSSARSNDICYQFYPGGNMTNDYNIVRNTKYAVNATIKGISLSDQRIIVRVPNSYIVAPGQTVYIPVRGANQSDLGIQIPDVKSSALQSYIYWQTTPGLVTAAMDYSNGYIKVTASASAATAGIIGGNAIVGVTTGTGTAPAALWSWHIWVTNYNPNLTNLTQNGYVWMDRNLGALEACNGTNTFDRCGGLFYEWGRKDPFPGVSSDGGEMTNYYNGSITATTGLYVRANAQNTGTVAPNYNLPLAVHNPLTYYYSVGTYDWYSPYILNNNTLWGLIKTVYDPCPAGWKVPPDGSWLLGFPPNPDTWNHASLTVSQTNYAIWTNNSVSSYYPVPGNRNFQNGLLDQEGKSGLYWMATANSLSVGNGMGLIVPARTFGSCVRCVKE